ncbi:hypothetical protein SmJEL517_g05681 [Synchytrium microbalum]|uniref:Core Histone H2A/H2B/H3 domain-containing protein n=1 Tax=Synchytrium microbalum TaxID=1806994 RepID=A0A507BYH1_9FUNG|nr:uncharacterized protein SmJEL517_g05681 [Synchytrium microbalum]TPX30844.1 hypothetical protein SmJEL517_g05681 [Synchytrium microbalum]
MEEDTHITTITDLEYTIQQTSQPLSQSSMRITPSLQNLVDSNFDLSQSNRHPDDAEDEDDYNPRASRGRSHSYTSGDNHTRTGHSHTGRHSPEEAGGTAEEEEEDDDADVIRPRISVAQMHVHQNARVLSGYERHLSTSSIAHSKPTSGNDKSIRSRLEMKSRLQAERRESEAESRRTPFVDGQQPRRIYQVGSHSAPTPGFDGRRPRGLASGEEGHPSSAAVSNRKRNYIGSDDDQEGEDVMGRRRATPTPVHEEEAEEAYVRQYHLEKPRQSSYQARDSTPPPSPETINPIVKVARNQSRVSPDGREKSMEEAAQDDELERILIEELGGRLQAVREALEEEDHQRQQQREAFEEDEDEEPPQYERDQQNYIPPQYEGDTPDPEDERIVQKQSGTMPRREVTPTTTGAGIVLPTPPRSVKRPPAGKAPVAQKAPVSAKKSIKTIHALATKPKQTKAARQMRHLGKKSAREKDRFSLYIYRVLKQVAPDLGISRQGMSVADDLIHDVFERLAHEAAVLLKKDKVKTLAPKDIKAATELLLSGELRRHAAAEANKAMSKFVNAR